MPEPRIRFDDGAAYDQGMGRWSLIAGNVFLDWLAPAAGLRWIDVGCGSGAFSELVALRCAPAESQGVDPELMPGERELDCQFGPARKDLGHGTSHSVGTRPKGNRRAPNSITM